MVCRLVGSSFWLKYKYSCLIMGPWCIKGDFYLLTISGYRLGAGRTDKFMRNSNIWSVILITNFSTSSLYFLSPLLHLACSLYFHQYFFISFLSPLSQTTFSLCFITLISLYTFSINFFTLLSVSTFLLCFLYFLNPLFSHFTLSPTSLSTLAPHFLPLLLRPLSHSNFSLLSSFISYSSPLSLSLSPISLYSL